MSQATDAHEVPRYRHRRSRRWLPLLVALALLAAGAWLCWAAPPEPVRCCDTADYHVEWRWLRPAAGCNLHSSELEIMPAQPLGGGSRRSHTLSRRVLYRWRSDRPVLTVEPWEAPSGTPMASGVMVTLLGETGLGTEYVVIASRDGRRFHVALDEMSFLRDDGRGPEFVDLDGDTGREIVLVPDYQGLDRNGDAPAQAWKWSPRRQRYVMVRESSYRERLKPLKLNRFR